MHFDGPFFAGGLACINFVNTIDHLLTPPEYDFLPDASTVLDWGRAAGIVRSENRKRINSGGPALAKLLDTRGLVLRLLLHLVRTETPAEADVSLFNRRALEAAAQMKFVPQGNGYTRVCVAEDPLERILGEVVRSTADLLLSDQSRRVKQCEACGWLFYDVSRNRSRRWCKMSVCGNRAKARRHYARIKQRRTVQS
jgi:predicted RNA-binding Zn ribbon-like protein